MVLKFLTIITPNNNNFFKELCFNSVIEVLENRGNFKFIGDKLVPSKMGMIINESYKPPFPK